MNIGQQVNGYVGAHFLLNGVPIPDITPQWLNSHMTGDNIGQQAPLSVTIGSDTFTVAWQYNFYDIWPYSGTYLYYGAYSTSVIITGNGTAAEYQQILDQIQIDRGGYQVTWTLTDVNGNASAPVTQSINNSTPITAHADANSVVAGGTVTATAATGVLANESNPNGRALSVNGVSDASHGTGTVGSSLAGVYGHLTLNADGSYSYVADNASAIYWRGDRLLAAGYLHLFRDRHRRRGGEHHADHQCGACTDRRCRHCGRCRQCDRVRDSGKRCIA